MIVVKCDMCQKIIKKHHANKRYNPNGKSLDLCDDCLPIHLNLVSELNEYREELEKEFNKKIKEKEAELLEAYEK